MSRFPVSFLTRKSVSPIPWMIPIDAQALPEKRESGLRFRALPCASAGPKDSLGSSQVRDSAPAACYTGTKEPMRRIAIMILPVFCLSFDAVAAQPEDADAAALQKGGKDGEATYVFDDDNVDGEILRPEGANVGSRNRSRHASLITIRNNFIGEMIRLANDI